MKQQEKMQRVQNVKKKFLLIVLICSINFGYSQKKLEGTYSICNNVVDNGKCLKFQFLKNGIFKRNTTGELGEIDYGEGHYLIKNDSLVLNYDLTELKESSRYKFKSYNNSKDSIQVKIKIQDFNNTLWAFSTVSTSQNYTIEANENGIALLKFKKQKGKQKIDIFNICCGNYSIIINKKLNYEIDVFIKYGLENSLAFKNDIVKYKIIKLSKEEIKLKIKSGIMVLKKKI